MTKSLKALTIEKSIFTSTMETWHLRFLCAGRKTPLYARRAPAHELGTRLVERANRRVRLTAAGELFLVRAPRMLEQICQAVPGGDQSWTGWVGTLRDGCSQHHGLQLPSRDAARLPVWQKYSNHREL